MPLNRRHLLAGSIGFAAGPALAQGNNHAHQAGQFERLSRFCQHSCQTTA